MANPYLGEIRIFGFNFAPVDWMLCDGQLLSIAQYSALFALLGTTYGGNGVQTFGLPNLQSRFPIHQGQGPGLSNYVLGEMTGLENTTLLSSNMPAHTHTFNVTNAAANTSTPSATTVVAVPLATPHGTSVELFSSVSVSPANTSLAPTTIGVSGSNIPISILPPLLCVNFCICVAGGIFPSRG